MMSHSWQLPLLVTTMFISATSVLFLTVSFTRVSAQDLEDISNLPYVFESTSLPVNQNGNFEARYMPSVGNGHVATTIFTDTVYMNGLYNGERGESHRARVPSRNNIRIDPSGLTFSNETFSLNVQNGTFIQQFVSGDYQIELRIYAHRVFTKVIVSQIAVTPIVHRGTSFELSLIPSLNQDSATSNDLNLQPEVNYTSVNVGAKSQCGATKIVEDSKFQGTPSSICVITTDVPAFITGNRSALFSFFTAYDKTLEGAAADFDKVVQLSTTRPEEIYRSHVESWQEVWDDGRIEVQGNLPLAKLMYGAFYYILSSLPVAKGANSDAGQFYGLSPGGLAYGDYLKDYQGHSFWDTETWMYPPVLYFHPELAKALLNYRLHSVPAARDRATETGFKGSRFAWESAFTGREVTPDCCPETRDLEIHITGDIAFAIRQYIASTRDEEWLVNNTAGYATNGCGLVREIAEFWNSRMSYNAGRRQFDINGVTPPDEDHSDVNNSVFTNVAAGYSIFFAEYAKCLCGDAMETFPQDWLARAEAIAFPYDSARDYHPEFEGYDTSAIIKQADVVLLGFPLLYSMNESTRRNDLLIYETVTRDTGPAMTWAMHTIGFLELGEDEKASALFNRSFEPYMRQPFKVWTEARAPDDGAVNFITGMGGFLQQIISGYGGLRLHPGKLEFDRPKSLPNSQGLKLHGLKYLGSKFSIETRQELDGAAVFTLQTASRDYPLELAFIQNGSEVIVPFATDGAIVRVEANVKTTVRTKTPSACQLPLDRIGGIYNGQT